MITIDQKIAEFFQNNPDLNPNDWPLGNLLLCLIALILCVVLVGIIGIEREKRGRSAGLRTHLLVGLGSTILMIISIYGFPQIFGNRDVARLAAQIVTGVGFLGAGAIIHNNSGIKGLTTAGTIWASMAIGLACGSFNFVLAILGALLIIVVLVVFRKVEVRLTKTNPTIILTGKADQPIIGRLAEVCKKHNCSMHHIAVNNVENSNPELVEIVFQINFEEKECDTALLIAEMTEAVKPESIQLLSHI